MLVVPGDSEAFLQGATALAMSPVLVARLGRAARQAAEALDWARVEARFEALLREHAR